MRSLRKLSTIALLILVSGASWAQNNRDYDCDELVSEDTRVLCRQNNQILRTLRNGGGNQGNLKACTVTYCYYTSQNCAEGAGYRNQCTSSNSGNPWYFRTIDLEARNRAHAREVFEQSDAVQACGFSGSTLASAFESAVCDP